MSVNMRPAWPQGSGATPNRPIPFAKNGLTVLRRFYLSFWVFPRRHL